MDQAWMAIKAKRAKERLAAGDAVKCHYVDIVYSCDHPTSGLGDSVEHVQSCALESSPFNCGNLCNNMSTRRKSQRLNTPCDSCAEKGKSGRAVLAPLPNNEKLKTKALEEKENKKSIGLRAPGGSVKMTTSLVDVELSPTKLKGGEDVDGWVIVRRALA